MHCNRALVTGAAGFIGSRLARVLVERGWVVHGYDLEDGWRRCRDTACTTTHESTGTALELKSILEIAKPSVVFHLASLYLTTHRAEQVDDLIDANVRFGANLAEAMEQTACRSLVNVGTSWQHFEVLSQAYRPVNLYAATKEAFEVLLEYYVDRGALNVATLKLFDTYGPDDPRPKLFALLRKASETGDVLEMSGGQQVIDLLHVDDVCQALLVAAQSLLAGNVEGHERYAISSGQALALRDIVAVFRQLSGRELNVAWGVRPYREREVMSPWTDGKPLPNWAPRIGLEDGVRSCLVRTR